MHGFWMAFGSHLALAAIEFALFFLTQPCLLIRTGWGRTCHHGHLAYRLYYPWELLLISNIDILASSHVLPNPGRIWLWYFQQTSSNPLDFVDWVLSVRSAAVVSGYHDSLLQARPLTQRCPDFSSHLIRKTHVPFVSVFFCIKIRSRFTLFTYLLYLYLWPMLIQER